MSQKNDRQRENGDGRWDSFSVYRDISKEVSTSVYTAIDAHSRISSMHTENVRIDPEFAALVKAEILAAAMELSTEIKQEKNRDIDVFQDFHDDWHGRDGYLNKLRRSTLSQKNPDWLTDFVEQIHEAAWELGYLRAGRREERGLDDRDEQEARQMFEDIFS